MIILLQYILKHVNNISYDQQNVREVNIAVHYGVRTISVNWVIYYRLQSIC